ncbi:PASTA domain-containing protein [Granulicella sibirica]|uniref:Serine/threonine protein kinase n=1 Tax=Granulicella sibirica TaxID=2479048 RepID=A0A4Q0T0C0_9BACT|nr:PASTA domain-containing protein [Granulicella sibirica]RXH56152.1 serine/threonine protein kinase [Granulicella sibirica]
MSTQLRIKRLFNFALGSMAMIAVAVVSAFITMRLAIHGREVEVPALAGLSVDDAQQRASSKGLSINVENHFYSTSVPAGHILSQSPSPGETVRRDWQVRVTESLGNQRVAIPDVIGQSERSATIALRRLSLELGTVSYIPTDGPPDTIIAQTPPPNAENIDGPRVSLLVSQTADAQSPQAVVMPTLTGLSPSSAASRAAAAGLHVVANQDPNAAAQGEPNNPNPAPQSNVAFDVPVYASGNVIGQYPAAGHRVVRGTGVHLTYAQNTPTAPAPDAPSAQ